MPDTAPTVIDYWNSRAGMGDRAGTNDVIAKQLEMKTLCEHIHNGESVLDMGCGNAMSMVYLAAMRDITIHGVDNSKGMIDEACKYAAENKLDTMFNVGSVVDFKPRQKYDTVYTERTIVNLPDWKTQRAAILNILQNCVRPGGRYLMMENSADGLKQINAFRSDLGLPEIVKPWHNRYLFDRELATIEHNEHGELEDVVNYSGVYYFMSRVCTAYLAAMEGKDPAYDAVLNKAAIKVAQVLGKGFTGQGRLWVWRAHD